MAKKLLAPVSLLAFLFSACASNASQSNENPLFAPQMNPSPKYFMTVMGHIDTNIPARMKLQLFANYQTNNETCLSAVNSLEGISRPQTRTVTYLAKPDVKGNYVIKIPIDYYLPGNCQWTVGSMQNVITNNGVYPITFAFFTDSNNKPENSYSENPSLVFCNQKKGCYWKQVGGYDKALPINHNYTYQYDILDDGDDKNR